MITKLKRLLKKVLPENFILCLWHYPRAALAAFIYNFPAKKIIVVGVAGTKGKTTTCHLISQILEKADKKVAMISTVFLKINQKEELNKIKMTSPSPFFLQKFIKKAIKANCEYLILEISSHALVQHRIFGVPFKIVVLTNLMPDHLDYHKDARNYWKCHQKMISPYLQSLILNGDDPNLEEFLKRPLFFGRKIIYGIDLPFFEQDIKPQPKNLCSLTLTQRTGYFKKDGRIKNKRDLLAKDIRLDPQGSSFVVESDGNSEKINLPFLGEFNIYNALAAIALGISQKISLRVIKIALQSVKPVPGRLEKINCGQDFEIIVDYAHSLDSLKVLFDVVNRRLTRTCTQTYADMYADLRGHVRRLTRTITADSRGQLPRPGTDKLLYEDLTYKIRGATSNVRKKIGLGHKESVYQRALEEEFKALQLNFEREKSLDVTYNEKKIGIYRPDFIVEDKIVVEVKTLSFVGKNEERQIWSYLKGSKYKLLLLINFSPKDIYIKRLIYDTARNIPRQSAFLPRQSASSPRKSAVITLFGACGERDATQRPLMGQIIDKNSDFVIITNDDPYGEDPEKIAREIIVGIKDKILDQNLWKILDRRSAIERALSLAQKDDLVLILGKGAEQLQIFKDKKIPWDDRRIVREVLEKIILDKKASV